MIIDFDENDIWKIKGGRLWKNSQEHLYIEFVDKMGKETGTININRETLNRWREDIDYILESTKDVTGKTD